jgi:hypothetical protein
MPKHPLSLRQNLWPLLLGVAGLVPFFAAPVAMYFYPNAKNLWVVAQINYAAIILSFLGAQHWVFGLQQKHVPSLLWGITPALLGWLMTLTAPYPALYGLAMCFFLVLVMDMRLVARGWLPAWYGDMRVWITVLVILSLGLSAMQLQPVWQIMLRGDLFA